MSHVGFQGGGRFHLASARLPPYNPTMTILRATLLGSFRLWQDDEPLDLGSTRLDLLLAYLLLAPNRSHPRQALAFRFWPDSTDAQARTNLRKALYRLRRRWPDSERFLHISPPRASAGTRRSQ